MTVEVVWTVEVTVGTVLAGAVGAEVCELVVDGKTVSVVAGARDVVDDDVDSVGRVVSGNVVEANISGNVVGVNVDVVELLSNNGSELLEELDGLSGSLVGGTVLVVVVLVGHTCKVVEVVVEGKDVVSSTVVVVCSVVVVATSVVVVDSSVVGTTAVKLADKSYCTPDHHASGLPQQTPARSRYQPGCNSTDRCDCKPNQSSFAASNWPVSLYSQSIGSDP